MKIRIIGALAIAAVSTVILGSCASDPDSAGLEYMPDMYRSPAIEPYVDYGHIQERENKEVKVELSAMTPPSGTIPYYGTDSAEVALMMPYKHKAASEFRVTHGLYGEALSSKATYELAAMDTENPLALPTDEEELKEFWSGAKELFNSMCSHCHGEKGDGNGPMMANGVYAGVPDYADKMALSNGQMFYSIYYGKGAMGSHRSQLNKKEIWTMVHYIRKFQNPDYPNEAEATPEDVEGEEAAEEGENN